jgi:predicted ATPase
MKYVAATLCQPVPIIVPLGATIQSKTAGNLFYIRELLNACHREKCVWYDYRESGWLFDVNRVSSRFQMEHYNDSLRDDFLTSRLNELLPS